MCGIAGIVNLTGEPANEAAIRAMCDAIRHRGPDDSGYSVDGCVALGSRRLAIIDVSAKGRQPIWNEDRTVSIVYNGEVYNYAEIRKTLEGKGHLFHSSTDTEVILHAYEEWGEECVHRFNGMWAFAIQDRRKGLLFLSRDRFGVKPLHYFADRSRFLFCSEIRGILTQNVPRIPDGRSILDYLVYRLLDHNERTFFAGISRLAGGHNLVLDLHTGRWEVKRWYELRRDVAWSEDTAQKVRDAFTDSVRLRLIADVPVGACLSGGIDSSSIVCTMRKLEPEHDIRTFSAVYPGMAVDESRYVRSVVERTDVDAAYVTPTAGELVRDIPDLIRTQEEPFTDTTMYAQYRVMRLAGEHGMKVLLDGQGNDETFAGYDSYFGFRFYELMRGLRWFRMLREMRHYYRLHRMSKPYQALGYLLMPDFAKPYLERLKFADWIGPDFYRAHSGEDDSYQSIRECRDVRAILENTVLYSSIPQLLHYEDRNSMRWSIESRVPFLDYRLVELALAIDSEQKVKDGLTKRVFREAMRGILPDMIMERTDKIGFSTPERTWFSDPRVQKFFRDIVQSDRFAGREYWDAAKFRAQFDRFAAGARIGTQEIWRPICVELWLREFMD